MDVGLPCESIGTEDHFYRPQRNWGKVIFSVACIKNSVQRGRGALCPIACWDTPTLVADTTPKQTPTPGADTPPQRRHPPGPVTPLD